MSPPLRAAVVFVFALAFAACGGDDDGPPADASASVDASAADGAAPAVDGAPADGAGPLVDGGIAGTIVELLPGTWEGVALGDSGGAMTPVPPGTFVVFDNATFKFGCGGTGSPWSVVGPAQIHIDFGGGSGVDWYILTLNDTELVFGEGGDVFYYERRDVCPL